MDADEWQERVIRRHFYRSVSDAKLHQSAAYNNKCIDGRFYSYLYIKL